MKRKISKGLLAITTLILMLSMSVLPALAVHDLGLFELDRNATDQVGGGDDWATLYTGGGSAADFTGILEDTMGSNPLGSTGTQFQAGGSKDDLDLGPGGATGQYWKWEPGEPLDKDDITNAYAAAYVNTVDTGDNDVGDLIIYFGLDRFANNGSAQVGFWFFQNQIGLTTTPSGGGYLFSGVHKVGDILVQSNFTQGGVIENISVFKWVGSGGSHGTLDLVFSAADCIGPPGSGTDDAACATVNRGDTPSPWPFTPKFGSPGTFPQGSFYEGGINITRLVPEAGCFSSFLAETRSSTPFDSRLKDFALGSFELCDLTVTKDGDTLSKVGDDVDYTITIENTGAVTLYKDDITDTLLGDITLNGVDQANPYVISNTCGASLAAGASCTITLTRTVQAGDPDPLDNTVTVIYNSSAGLTGDEISRSDDHSVNLFQPASAIDKTGDELSKVGDDVNYTITLSNNSSDDTPALNCTAEDTLLGTLFSGVLPLGDTVLNPTYIVQPGDPDPLDNTVTLTCSPEGFSNVLEASDSHSVNLFQPAIAVDKTGDTLSKVGDEVSYTFTLSNNSSDDTPALNCTAVDTLFGTIFDGVLPLGDTVINQSRTVLDTDPDPLDNTVTLTCSPEGFPNVLEVSDSHSVNLFQPTIAVDKTGDTLSKVGDEVNYTFTLSNNSSADTPALNCTAEDTLLGTIFDGVLPLGDTVVNRSRTVQAGDPDPLDNTVTLTCSPEGFPNVLEASDNHSVNLFQPAIAIDKTGDELSKVGDDVNYTITLSNNSSADTPALNCTATDSLLGVVFDGVLPLGDTVLSPSHTVQPGDPDPLENSVSMTCTVSGFSNVLNAGPATHSTNLFQPAVEVIKTGPSTATVGETITYQFTINNLSSGDSPALILDSVTDTVLGDLTATANANGCGTLGFGGSCSFSFDYTIQASDPNPLVNVVTVHYHPDGFPNDITDDDDHSVEITFGNVQITPTGTECEDFLAGTATDLPTLEVNPSGNLSPGAFIHFTSQAITGATTIEVSVSSNPDAEPDPTVIEAKLFAFDPATGACTQISSQPGVTVSIVNNVAIFELNAAAAAQYPNIVTYTKYNSPTGTVGTVFTFETSVNGVVVPGLTDTLVVVDNE